METVKTLVVASAQGESGKNRQNIEKIQESENVSYDTVVVDTCHLKCFNIHKTSNVEESSLCTLWAVGGNDVPVQVH